MDVDDNMEYAVFDWDNTVRRGFTLFSWMDFLLSKNILNKVAYQKIKTLQNKYSEGDITHDDYAWIAGEIYASGVKGISRHTMSKLVDEYMELDYCAIYPFVETVFSFLNSHNVKSIVVSGAPSCILNRYTSKFSLYKIYAFGESFFNGVCDGRVSYNYGVNKRNTIQKLHETYGTWPIISFGDSESDIPLFDMSSYPFCVVSESNADYLKAKPYGSNVKYIDCKISSRKVLELLEKALNR